MWGPAIVMVRACMTVCMSVCLSDCHTRIAPKLSEIDVWLLGISNRNQGCHQIRDRKYGSAILGVSGLALRQFRQKWAVGPVNGSVRTVTSLDTRPALPVSSCTSCASSYAQLHWKKRRTQPHWAPWRASYRHVPWRAIPCFTVYSVKYPVNSFWKTRYIYRVLS